MIVAIFVAVIALVIMFHEFGHFATAKLFGMKAEQFFIGFGPTIWSTQRGETEYGIKAIPAGGFVKIVGMNRFEETDPADDGRLFYQQPAWQRVIVLVAGSFTHFIVAAAMLFFGLWLLGVPTDVPSTVVAAVQPGTPADEAGLVEGDVITAVGGVDTSSFEAASERIRTSIDETVDVEILRDGEARTLEATVGERVTEEGETVGFLGFVPDAVVEDYGVGEALVGTWSGDFSLPRLVSLNIQGLGQAFSPEAFGSFFEAVSGDRERSIEDGGPTSLVGAGQVVNEVGRAGNILGVLQILASLNIVLGTLNMLPLPPLDGGHVATLAVEEGVNFARRRRGRREKYHVDPRIIMPIALTVIMLFGMLFLTSLYLDITQPLTLG